MPSFTVFKGSKEGKPVKSTVEKPDELKGDYCLIKVKTSGLCGTDLHFKTQDMGLGHEGVGIVEDVGPSAKYLKKGDRVGWGYEHDCCDHCKQCIAGWSTFCPERKMYGSADLDQGSFSTQAVWRESFLFKIPDSISDVDAAPLQCAGATVFNALQGVGAGDVVGVMGVGGLGHLAIQFAAKMGCRVVVLSGSDRKKDEAMKLGAGEFIATKDAKELKVESKITRLLVTTSVQPNWEQLLSVLDPRAVIYPLSVSTDKFEFPYMPMIAQGLTIQGSLVAAKGVHREMLDFAGFHGVKPICETFPMTEEGIQEAMDRLEKGDIKYRAVLVNKD